MPDNNRDNPYAAPEPVEETPVVKKSKPATAFGCVHVTLLVLAAIPFLYCLLSPLLLEVREGWQHARAFAFVVAYIGLFFRKEWAYWLCAVIACSWMVQVVMRLENATPNPNEPGLVVIFSTFYAAFAVWSAVIALLAAICALTFLRQKRSDSNENS